MVEKKEAVLGIIFAISFALMFSILFSFPELTE